MTEFDIGAGRREFRDDGVTVIRGALDSHGLALCRAAFDILAWAVDPGDVVVFHPAMLHGGAPPTRVNAGAR